MHNADEVVSRKDIINTGIEITGKPIVLVVEDNNELKDFIASVFQNDYKVITANNGINGLSLSQKEITDLIISDVMMPEMDGYTFCREIQIAVLRII